MNKENPVEQGSWRRDVFLDFLNPDVRRVAGAYKKYTRNRHVAEILRGIRAATLLGDRLLVPPFFPVQCPLVQFALEHCESLFDHGIIVFPMRESDPMEFKAKKERQYRSVGNFYRGVFHSKGLAVVTGHPTSIIHRESRMGMSIANSWGERGISLKLLNKLKEAIPSQFDSLARIPRALVEQKVAVTAPAILKTLGNSNPVLRDQIDLVLQGVYGNIYIGEYDAVSIRNLPIVPNDFGLRVDGPAYDFKLLRDVWRACNVFEALFDLTNDEICLLRLRSGYLSFLKSYVLLSQLQPSEDVILTFAVARRSGSETLKKTFSYLRKAKQNRKAVSSGLLVCLDEILYELSSRVNSDSNRSDLGEKSGPGVTMPERIHGGQSRSGPFILVRAVTNERSITNHRNRTMRVLVFSALDDEISFLIEPKDGYQYKMNEKFQWVFDPRQDIHKSSLALKSGEVIEVFAATAHEAGLTQTAIRATECTRTIEPDLAIMIGICGGRRKAAETGDIVMPTRSFLYAFGALESGQIKPEIRDEIVGERVSAWAHNILGGQIEMLYKSFPKLEGRPRSVPRFIKAPIACGDLVIKDENVLEEIASQKDRKVCGVDMESYAFIRAARQQLSSTEKVVVIKSVSDYSDKSKGDSYHDYCMYITSACAVALVEAVATMPHLV